MLNWHESKFSHLYLWRWKSIVMRLQAVFIWLYIHRLYPLLSASSPSIHSSKDTERHLSISAIFIEVLILFRYSGRSRDGWDLCQRNSPRWCFRRKGRQRYDCILYYINLLYYIILYYIILYYIILLYYINYIYYIIL